MTQKPLSTFDELVQDTKTTLTQFESNKNDNDDDDENEEEDEEQLQEHEILFAEQHKQGNKATMVAIIAGTVVFWLCLCSALLCYVRVRRKQRALEPSDEEVAHQIALQRIPSPEYNHDPEITSPNPMYQYRPSSEGIITNLGHTRLRNMDQEDEDDEDEDETVVDDGQTYDDEPGLLLHRLNDTDKRTTTELSVTEDEKGELSAMYDNQPHQTAGASAQTKGNALTAPNALKLYDIPKITPCSPITTHTVFSVDLPMSARSDKQSLIGSYDESLDLLYGPGKKTKR